jgi:antitoxin component HigA of HigAB toxin-antitoxin module
MKTLKKKPAAWTDDYLELVKKFPLRIIRNEKEHEEAVSVLSRLLGCAAEELSAGTRDYADALSRFIQDYDEREHPLIRAKRSPLQKLNYVIEESGITRNELAKVLGISQPLTSHILTGKRHLTASHKRKLGEHFKIAPGYFL